LLAGSFGLLWVLAIGGANVLDPRRLDWLLFGDWAQHLTGWLFFRQSAWSWPLGSIPDLAAPAGTTVGYTDSIPWLALVCKALDPVLPDPFSYIGPWLVACFVLQGVFGARLLRSAGLDARAAALGGCLFVTAPILTYRVGHDALCAHFLILAALELSFRPFATAAERRRIVWLGFLWTAFAAGVHPYLAVMVAVLCAAAVARTATSAGVPSAAAALGLCLGLAALLLAMFFAFGYLGTGATTALPGFGIHSSDLAALVNPEGYSRFVPRLGWAPGQYEGFAYLGLGAIGLVGFALAAAAARRALPLRDDWRTRIPTGLVILLLAGFAWSHRVTWRGELLLDYSAYTAAGSPLLETFRVSGRFVWPLHYALLTLGIVGSAAALRSRPRALPALLALALALQVAEQLRHPIADRFPPRRMPVYAEDWQRARGAYRSVSLYPPVINASGVELCAPGGVAPQTLWQFALLAHSLRLPFGSAFVARANEERAKAACRITESEVQQNRLAPEKLYVMASKDRHAFRRAAPDSRCAPLDGIWACVASGNEDPFAQALAARAARVPEPAAALRGLVAMAVVLLARALDRRRRPARTPTSGGGAPGSRAPRGRARARRRS
jgi:hypothetical protein